MLGICTWDYTFIEEKSQKSHSYVVQSGLWCCCAEGWVTHVHIKLCHAREFCPRCSAEVFVFMTFKYNSSKPCVCREQVDFMCQNGVSQSQIITTTAVIQVARTMTTSTAGNVQEDPSSKRVANHSFAILLHMVIKNDYYFCRCFPSCCLTFMCTSPVAKSSRHSGDVGRFTLCTKHDRQRLWGVYRTWDSGVCTEDLLSSKGYAQNLYRVLGYAQHLVTMGWQGMHRKAAESV